MSITLTDDPIIALADMQDLLDISDEKKLMIVINSLSRRFLDYTGRVKINSSYTVAIEEWLEGDGTDTLWLHASPIHLVNGASEDLEISATIYYGDESGNVYTYNDSESDNDLVTYSDTTYGKIVLNSTIFPPSDVKHHIKVSYFGGWTEVPCDIITGAIMQAKVDVKRIAGEVGVTNRGAKGESTAYDVGGLIDTVRDIWRPYGVLV